MTTIPAPGADLATDERALFDAACREYKLGNVTASDLDFAWSHFQGHIWRSARANLAAVPASDSIDTHEFMQAFVAAASDIPNRDPYDYLIAYIHMHTARVVFACQREWGESAAAPAPVSGMPDLAKVEILLDVIRVVRQYPDFDAVDSPLGVMMDEALAGKVPALLATIDSLANGLMPQAPDTPNPTGETK